MTRSRRLLLLPIALLLVLAVAAAVGDDTYGYGEYYDDDAYWADDEQQMDGGGRQHAPYLVLDLDPAAPGNFFERNYMKCFLPFNSPEPEDEGEEDGGDGAWRVVDRGMEVSE